MNAKLEYCENKLEIIHFCHSQSDEELGNPYNCTFQIFVVSGRFQGYADGCEYDFKEFQKMIRELKKLVENQAKQVRLKEIGYGSEILFTGDGRGHIEVSGTVYGEAMKHVLQFSFPTDQTVYASFIKELESFV